MNGLYKFGRAKKRAIFSLAISSFLRISMQLLIYLKDTPTKNKGWTGNLKLLQKIRLETNKTQILSGFGLSHFSPRRSLNLAALTIPHQKICLVAL